MYLEKFPDKLKKLRLTNNLTQNELANILETTKQAISAYESGKSKPSLYALIRLSEYFNISLDSLVFDKETNSTIDFTSDLNTFNELRFEINSLLLFQETLSNKISELLNENHDKLLSLDSMLSKKYCETNPSAITSKTNSCEEEFADEITPDISLVEKEETHNSDEVKFRTIYIHGNIAAGSPCYALEEILGTFDIPEGNLNSSKEYFGLKVDGDSMNELYDNGELILVEKTSVAELNDIVIALISNISCEATVKKFRKKNNLVSLIPMSNNPIHKVQIYNVDDVIILGKVLGKLDDFLN